MALTRATDKIIANADGNLNLSGIVTATSFSGSGANLTGIDATAIKFGSDVKVQANNSGATVTGILTATKFVGQADISGGSIVGTSATFSGNVSIGGTLTYEDVTNIDSVGVVTARSGVKIGPAAGVAGTFFADGSYVTAGVITATTFHGSGANLTSLPTQITINNNSNGRVITATGNANELDGQANLTFSNSSNDPKLTITGSGHAQLFLTNTSGADHTGVNFGDSADTNAGMIQYSNSNNAMQFHTNGAERLRIDSNGKLLVGHTAAHSVGGGNSLLQIQATNSTGRLSVVQHRNEAGGSPFISLGKSRGTSNGSTTILQSGDEIGTLTWAGADGNDLDNQACCITGVVDGTPGSNDMPGRLEFRTTADGSSSATTRLKISKEGYVTKPNLPTFCARWQSPDAQDLNSGDIIIFTHVASATTRWNNGGHYSTSTGKFTAPVAGFYYFAGRVMSTGWNNGDDIQDLISIQSSAGIITYPTQRRSRFRSDADANGYYTSSISAQVQAGAGATFWLQSNRNGNGSGWDSASAQYSFFTGWLIG